MSKTEQVIQVLMQMSVEDIRSIVTTINSEDDSLHYLQVYYMDDFDEITKYYTPTDIANKIYFGDFRIIEDYFKFDHIENLESFYEFELAQFYKLYIEEIAERVVELHDYISFSIDIEEIFEGEEVNE